MFNWLKPPFEMKNQIDALLIFSGDPCNNYLIFHTLFGKLGKAIVHARIVISCFAVFNSSHIKLSGGKPSAT
jgi:hypothetical protein